MRDVLIIAIKKVADVNTKMIIYKFLLKYFPQTVRQSLTADGITGGGLV